MSAEAEGSAPGWGANAAARRLAEQPAEVPEPSAPADIDALLTSRLRRRGPGPVLAVRKEATVVLDAGEAGCWTLRLEDGRLSVRRGRTPEPPTTVVRSTAPVIGEIMDGRRSGARAFLDGDVTVRGDLSLSLALEDLFEPIDRPLTHPHVHAAKIHGLRTTWLEAGPPDAPPVVVLHGLGATNASVLPVLEELSRDHRVVAPDLPGHGATAGPRAYGRAYSPAWVADWLDAFQRHVGARPAVLVGNSLGGRLSIEAGLTNPKAVRSLVLLCPSPAFRRLRQWVPLVRLLRPQAAVLPVKVSHTVAAEAIRAMFSDPSRLPDAFYDAAADEYCRVISTPRGRVAFAAYARNIYLEQAYGERGFWSRLPTLMPPALFIWGDRDRLVPASFSRHVEAALPEATSVVLADCGHVPQFEWPERTGQLLRAHLDTYA
jgi:pimeloyl-ACP methyl ester carboxylesterase